MARSNDYQLTVGIDIGMSYSSNAYVFKSNYPDGLCTVYLVQSGSNSLVSGITHTSLLLNEQKKFIAFGCEAEKKFKKLIQDGVSEKYYYIDLHESPHSRESLLQSNWMLKDTTGKELPFVDLLEHGIRYITNCFINLLEERGTMITTEDIQWVLIAPTVLDDCDESLMMKGAVQAGLDIAHCTVVTRTEAILFGFKHTSSENSNKVDKTCNDWRKCVLVEVGEHDTRVSVAVVENTGKLGQLQSLGDRSCGVREIFLSFVSILAEIFGSSFIDLSKTERNNAHTYSDMKNDFYRTLQNRNKTLRCTSVKIPVCNSEVAYASLKENIKESKYKDTWSIAGDKFRIKNDIEVLTIKHTDKIVDFVSNCLKLKDFKGVAVIFLAGWASVIPEIAAHIKRMFADKCVVTCRDHTHIAARGGTIYGREKGIFRVWNTYADLDFVKKR